MRKVKMLKVLIAALFIQIGIVPALIAQGTASISGTIVNRNTQQALEGITITVNPGNTTAVSDAKGQFRITGLVPGSYTISFTGVNVQEKSIANTVVNAGNEVVLSIELEPAVTQLNNIVVNARKNTAKAATLESPLSIQRLTTEDIKANPGGNFDISKAIQSLPGIGGGAAGGSFRNDIIIRGGAPSENVFYLDGIEVPIINHFSTQGSGGGPQGILNVSFIEDVRLSTSAFDARYDNALSSVFQFKQKNGNSNRLQGNLRLSGTEFAATFDGPLTKNTTFLASARRSYLQLLFKALDLPIRPNYWDFQFKTTTKINQKLTLNLLGIGAIDEFSFAVPKEATPEKLYTINSNPIINQWSYTVGASLRYLINNGFMNLSLSRNTLDNSADKYEDNQNPQPNEQTLRIKSREMENKLRFDVTNNMGNMKISYGLVAQYVQFNNEFLQVYRPAIVDDQGNLVQPAETFQSFTDANFLRYGAFVQAGTRLLNKRLALSGGIRVDANTAKNGESNLFKQLSPRISASYAFTDKWNLSASYGIYYRLPSYAQMAFVNTISSSLVMNPGDYIRSEHFVAGVEYLPSNATRFTVEGFYKNYSSYPVSINDEISIANKGTDLGAIGNEPIQQDGKGRAYGIEFLAQQKLTKNFFGILSYTLYRSEFSGLDGVLAPASWDNRHLLSLTMGYKIKGNWEIGLKFRYQGAAPYSPYDLPQSQLNYLTLGTGIFNYGQVNTLRLTAFNAGDIRIDKKWNFKRTTLDLFLDVQNFYGSKAAGIPQYTFKRNETNTDFVTTDGQPVRQDGSNAIPVILPNIEGTILPTIGFIIEF
jgi:outer membrane receptor for ferrienterochelin and colicin